MKRAPMSKTVVFFNSRFSLLLSAIRLHLESCASQELSAWKAANVNMLSRLRTGWELALENLGKVLKLKDAVSYQEGSIVSRTLIDKESGTVTLFAFDGGQALSEHTAPFDALVIVVEGEVDITISGNVSHLKEGEMTILPALKPHALKAVTRVKMALVMIRSQN